MKRTVSEAGFSPVLVILLLFVVVLGAGAAWFFVSSRTARPTTTACTQEAKVCPDGSAVGRTGPNCSFAPCPQPTSPPPVNVPTPLPPSPLPTGNCTSDAQCPSGATCQATQGSGTVSPNGGPSTFVIVQGACKWKEGGRCATSDACQAGLLCHDGVCTSPQDGTCSGAGGSCAAGYTCVQDCGPPVERMNEPAPGWHCLLNEVAAKPRMCPICLASNTMIATPAGAINVTNVKIGTIVWSVDARGAAVASKVIRVSKSSVPATHHVVHITMTDGREVWASPNHPTADGRLVSDLRAGDRYDGVIAKTETVPYWDTATYDILPDSATGEYRANGILLGSTLFPRP